MSGISFRSVFEFDTIEPIESWNAVSAFLSSNDMLSGEYEFDGKLVDISKLEKAFSRSSCRTYFIEDGRTSIRHGAVRNYDYSFVRVEFKNAVDLKWDELVLGLSEEGNFVSAWLEDRDYAFWQNAEDPLQYKAAGKSYEGLPMKSNGLPAPLEQKVIDTSGNPGRWLHRAGYVEAVSSRMWFAEPFWKLTGGDPQKLSSIEDLGSGIARLKVQDNCFSSASGEEALRQKELRAILYPCSSEL